jgi:hypothetical protein
MIAQLHFHGFSSLQLYVYIQLQAVKPYSAKHYIAFVIVILRMLKYKYKL